MEGEAKEGRPRQSVPVACGGPFRPLACRYHLSFPCTESRFGCILLVTPHFDITAFGAHAARHRAAFLEHVALHARYFAPTLAPAPPQATMSQQGAPFVVVGPSLADLELVDLVNRLALPANFDPSLLAFRVLAEVRTPAIPYPRIHPFHTRRTQKSSVPPGMRTPGFLHLHLMALMRVACVPNSPSIPWNPRRWSPPFSPPFFSFCWQSTAYAAMPRLSALPQCAVKARFALLGRFNALVRAAQPLVALPVGPLGAPAPDGLGAASSLGRVRGLIFGIIKRAMLDSMLALTQVCAPAAPHPPRICRLSRHRTLQPPPPLPLRQLKYIHLSPEAHGFIAHRFSTRASNLTPSTRATPLIGLSLACSCCGQLHRVVT